MTKSIHKKTRLTSAKIRQLPAFRKARRLILRLEIQEGRAHGRGRTLIPPRRTRGRTQPARRSPASRRRATTDSGGGDGDGGDPEPEPPRRSCICSLPAHAGGGAL